MVILKLLKLQEGVFMKKLPFIVLLVTVVSFMFAFSVQAELIYSQPYEEQFPLTDEEITLSIFASVPNFVKDLETNEFTRWYEEKTNVKLEWDTVAGNMVDEKRNILLASGEYPDVLMNAGVPLTQMEIYGKQGIFIPLNDLIEDHSIYFKKLMKQYPVIEDYITSADGNIYSLPDFNQCFHCIYGKKMWIYKPWLDKLGLDMPETTDELYQVLKAFKEQDPNGNGKKDEIPLSGYDLYWANIDTFLINPFIYNPGDDRLYLQDGKVTVPFNKPDWKQGLKYMHKLYKEGLLYPESFTMDRKQIKQLGENPDVQILGAATALWFGHLAQNYGESGRYKNWVAVPPLKGPDGYVSTFYKPGGVSPGKFLITNKCKNPEIAIKWVDWFYSVEGQLTASFGQEGEGWRWAKEGEVGINGKPAVFKRIGQHGEMQNKNWNYAMPYYRPADIRLGEPRPDDPYYHEIRLYEETANKYAGKEIKGSYLPPLSFTEEEMVEVEDLRVSINNYVEESIAQFVVGARDIEKDWNNYLEEFKYLGLERYLELNQKAYDRKYGDK